ncbi:hypothetical protein HF086_011133 [Spodoptera exigua]|uniref:Citrate transporter-like domain-containing protein n=1 Tax=Spodoptera exigua TaxID=7107 RepID=A0A922MYR8_SPOEX|nr:hypothetical protein HF086_011133 [Spodoptera exigua]
MDKIVKSVKSWRHPRPAEELSRSQYSLVSTDLTDGAVQLWLGLPDEVKYDPALEQFRQHYEKEHGSNGVPRKTKNGSTKRLPLVNSAPHLNNNLQIPREEVMFINSNNNKCPSIDEKKEKILEEVPEPKKPSKSPRWSIILDPEDEIDFTEGETRTTVLKMDTSSGDNATHFLKMRTNVQTTTPFALSYTMDPLDISTGVIYACMLLGALTMAAVLISTTALAVLSIAGERPTLPELISWLDVETLLLLFSMMLLVSIMAETGLFDFLAVFTFEVTKGKIWPLITLLSAITAIISTVLDNVTTVLLMTPVTIRLCEVMDLDPIPVLMSMVIFSNIGGTVTPVGDPPNVIIASNKAVVQSISIWRRAADSLPHLSRDELVVRERLDRKVRKLTVKLDAFGQGDEDQSLSEGVLRDYAG